MTTYAKAPPDWIMDGEKFALIGFEARLARDVSRLDLPDGLTILPNTDFNLPDHWCEWLGSLRVEDIQSCTLFLLAKGPSRALKVLDGENQRLSSAVGHWFMGLMLTHNFALSDSLFITSGSCERGAVDVREFGLVEPPARSIVQSDGPISVDRLARAALMGTRLKHISQMGSGRNWRLLRCLRIYQDARREIDMLERIHQFTRCIEGLIVPKQGDTGKQFKSRTELFVGPRDHKLMGELYDVRSEVEHLHENKRLETYDRATRISLAKLEAVGEWIARTCLQKIILNPTLTDHFGSVASLEQFWAKDPTERQTIWGAPVDPRASIAGFDFSHVSDAELGARE